MQISPNTYVKLMRRSGSLLVCLLPCLASAMSVTLTPSVPSPQPLGTLVTWTAAAADTGSGTIWYRFSSHPFGEDLQVIKDFGPDNTVDWTDHNHENLFYVEVDARNLATGETAKAVELYELQSRVTSGQPVISPTAHPLVFLYSAPACTAGSRMQVRFTSPSGVATSTPYQDCVTGKSMNFYLAGMTAGTQYSVVQVVDTGSAFQNGPKLSLTTGAVPSTLVSSSVVQAPAAATSDDVLLQATIFTPTLATDLSGNILWYYDGNISFVTRAVPGGYFFGVRENTGGDQSTQLIREFDLTGMTVRETNAARVSEQLQAMGKRPISAFHHEARQLPDGRILALASVEQVLTDVQGPGPVDVLGDMIVIFDSNLQLVWAWDAFDHLDTARLASLNDQCLPGNCPPTFMNVDGQPANDWTHGNSVQQTPDGQLLYSARNQDWVLKIDYENGLGDGGVLWRLGNAGDFQLDGGDPSLWFSHQHDPQYLSDDVTITLFDNGNLRNADDPAANSRGQVWNVNESTLVAHLNSNFDLGKFSFALGAAQRLPDGNYHFDIGYLLDASSYAVEVRPDGTIAYSLKTVAPAYRSFRMPDLYNPPYGTH